MPHSCKPSSNLQLHFQMTWRRNQRLQASALMCVAICACDSRKHNYLHASAYMRKQCNVFRNGRVRFSKIWRPQSCSMAHPAVQTWPTTAVWRLPSGPPAANTAFSLPSYFHSQMLIPITLRRKQQQRHLPRHISSLWHRFFLISLLLDIPSLRFHLSSTSLLFDFFYSGHFFSFISFRIDISSLGHSFQSTSLLFNFNSNSPVKGEKVR